MMNQLSFIPLVYPLCKSFIQCSSYCEIYATFHPIWLVLMGWTPANGYMDTIFQCVDMSRVNSSVHICPHSDLFNEFYFPDLLSRKPFNECPVGCISTKHDDPFLKV